MIIAGCCAELRAILYRAWLPGQELATERIGVTISIDGPQEIQDKFRVFSNGQGSYAMAAPKIKALLARHRARPIGARVTLTKQTLDVKRIYKHLFEDLGFW